jgi:DNA-binding CsgD family transcriptional regulator
MQGVGDDPVRAFELAAALLQFWITRGHQSDIERAEAALDAWKPAISDIQAVQTRATALYWLANAIRFRNDQARAVDLCEESVALSRAIGDLHGLAPALSNLGFMLRDIPDYVRVRACAEEGIKAAHETADPKLVAWSSYVLASILWYARFVGDGAELTPLSPSFDPSRSAGGTGGEHQPQHEDEALARSLLEEALALDRQRGDERAVAVVLGGGGSLGHWAWACGDFAGAEAAYAEHLEIFARVAGPSEAAGCVRHLARVALGLGQPWRAARLLGAADAAYEATRTRPLPRVWPTYDVECAAVRARLNAEAFAAAWEEGRAMSWEQALDYALRRADPFGDESPAADLSATAPAAAARPPSALTPREREVAILVGRGYSNRRIAEELVIAEKTAEVHARNVREKLGLSSRAQIAAWAAQHGLLPADEE